MRGTVTLFATGMANASTGKNSFAASWTASAFNSGTSSAVAQNFQLQSEPVGNNTANPSASLNFYSHEEPAYRPKRV
jgi:hypothetical protein